LNNRWQAVGVTLAVVMLAGAVAPLASRATTGKVKLGRTVRITTPGTTVCPAEGEPEVTTTSAGTWVAYNDDHQCPLAASTPRFVELQLVPRQGGAPRFVEIPVPPGNTADGDPDLAPDPSGDGSVFLSTLWIAPNEGSLSLRILHVDSRLRVRMLPTPSLHQATNSDDKEFIATDTSRRSPYRGRLYVAWDDFLDTTTVVRAWDGQHWRRPVTLQQGIGVPDVAVGPTGTVAVGYETTTGVSVRLSTDGGHRFSRPVRVFTGGLPGSLNPSCPLRASVGTRQRAMRDVHVAFDHHGDLHVVAAMGQQNPATVEVPPGAGATSNKAIIEHAIVRHGKVVGAAAVTAPSTAQQWAPALAAPPSGGMAVSWLQTSDTERTSYDAWVAVNAPGTTHFSAPSRLSTDSSIFPDGTELVGNSPCYGIGDYIGMTSTPTGVATVWPTTQGTGPLVDSDVLLRTATVQP